jgi:hypothetical protein
MELSALDLSTTSEQGYEFEFIPEATGIGEGFFITVLGKHADTVKEWTRKAVNNMRDRERMLAKKGKDDYRKVEEDEAFGVQLAATTIIGWIGLNDGGKPVEFSKEMALHICKVNPEVRDQVSAASDLMSNFIKSK